MSMTLLFIGDGAPLPPPVNPSTPPFDYTATILSQYANSPTILAFLSDYSACLDQNANIDLFYNNVWNISIATGYGLDVWGRILGVTRYLNITGVPYQSFSESGGNSTPQAWLTLYGGAQTTTTYALSDDAFLLLLYAKAAANIWNGSIPALNAILRLLFPSQVAYVIDGLNMTMTYYFGFILTPVQAAIVGASGILPRPAGVQTYIVQI